MTICNVSGAAFVVVAVVYVFMEMKLLYGITPSEDDC